MPGCSFSKSAEIHNRDWLVTPLLSAISGKSATVRDQFIEGCLAKKPFMFSYKLGYFMEGSRGGGGRKELGYFV